MFHYFCLKKDKWKEGAKNTWGKQKVNPWVLYLNDATNHMQEMVYTTINRHCWIEFHSNTQVHASNKNLNFYQFCHTMWDMKHSQGEDRKSGKMN